MKRAGDKIYEFGGAPGHTRLGHTLSGYYQLARYEDSAREEPEWTRITFQNGLDKINLNLPFYYKDWIGSDPVSDNSRHLLLLSGLSLLVLDPASLNPIITTASIDW